MTNVADTEWIVVRPEGDIAGSELASVYEGEWRHRDSLGGKNYLELDGPHGIVRAYPTGQTEVSRAGDVAEVWRVPGDSGTTSNGHGLDSPHD